MNVVASTTCTAGVIPPSVSWLALPPVDSAIPPLLPLTVTRLPVTRPCGPAVVTRTGRGSSTKAEVEAGTQTMEATGMLRVRR
jgi:hypothetical protein